MYINIYLYNYKIIKRVIPVAEFFVLVCTTPKFICSSDDGAPRILITENDLL